WSQSDARLRLGSQLPPAGRVADTILFLLTLPPDMRLVTPAVQPLAYAVGSSVLGRAGSSKTQRGSAAADPSPARDVADMIQEPVKEPMMSPTSKTIGRLDGKVAIVTGGTGGLGLATCKAVAGEGAAVVVVDVNQERIDQCVAALPSASHPRGHMGFAMDVRQESDNQNLVQATLDRYGRIDALVACAGILRQRGTP